MPVVAGDMYINLGVAPTPDQVTEFLTTVDGDPSLNGVFMWVADDSQTTPALWQAYSRYVWKNDGLPSSTQPIGWAQVKAPLGLNIRATPWGTKLGGLAKDDIVPIWTIFNSQWAAITTSHDQLIYIGNTDYVSVVIDPSNLPQTPPPPPGLYQARVIPAAGLNVRDGINGTKIGALAVGTIVQVYQLQDGWAKIDINVNQWVNAQFINRIN
jgi:hypothetical protein